MKNVICLISSPPDSSQAQRGLELIQEWSKLGNKVQVCLIQDGVYIGLQKTTMQENDAFSSARWFVLEDDLKLRGFTAANLRPELKDISYDQLTQKLMEEADQVIGAF